MVLLVFGRIFWFGKQLRLINTLADHRMLESPLDKRELLLHGFLNLLQDLLSFFHFYFPSV